MKILLSSFLVILTSFAAAAEPPPERTCTLHFTWWLQPDEPRQLAFLQGKELIRFVPLEMNFETQKHYRGASLLTLLRKKAGLNSTPLLAQAGNPPKENLSDWEPLTTLTLPASSEVGVLLLMTPQHACLARVFDYDVQNFPYGTLRLVNLTPYLLSGKIDQAAFRVPSKGCEPLPVAFKERQISHLEIFADCPDQPATPIVSTKVIGQPHHRTLVFILEEGARTLQDTPTFSSRSITSIQPPIPPPKAGPDNKPTGSR